MDHNYWTYYKNEKTGYVQILQATWTNDMTDWKRKREGRIFTTEAAAREEASK